MIFIWFNTVQAKYDAGAKADKTVTAAAGSTNPGNTDTLAERDTPGRLNKTEVTGGDSKHPTNIHDTKNYILLQELIIYGVFIFLSCVHVFTYCACMNACAHPQTLLINFGDQC